MAGLSIAPLVKAAGLAFAFGSLLLFVLNIMPWSRAAARQLWPLLASEAVILLGGILPFLLPPSLSFACLLGAGIRIGYEAGTVCGKSAGRPLATAGMVAFGCAGMWAWLADGATVWWTGLLLLILAAAIAFAFRKREAVAGPAWLVVFPLLPFLAFVHAARDAGLVPFLLLSFLLVEVFDSFSLLGGRLYGRTPLAPRLSPKKTWEGFATGAAALLAAVLALAFAMGQPLGTMLLAGFVILAAAPLGDLLGSLPKRRAGVKDYPAVMAVQGGLLDITDSWLVAGPCLAAVALACGWL